MPRKSVRRPGAVSFAPVPPPSPAPTNGVAPATVSAPGPPERVLVFPAARLKDHSFTGVRSDVLEMVGRVFPGGTPHCHEADFVPRTGLLETDETSKQVVSVVVPWCPATGRVWCFRRGSTESRLGGKVSCLPGGHVSLADMGEELAADPLELCYRAVIREMNEEMARWYGSWKTGDDGRVLRLAGALNDDSDPVGRVHFGVLYVLRLNEESPPGRMPFCPASGTPVGWVSAPDLAANAVGRAGAESWSVHVGRYLVEHPSPTLR